MAALGRFGTRHRRGSTGTNGVSATLGDGPSRRIPLAGALLTAAACAEAVGARRRHGQRLLCGIQRSCAMTT
jgi:hypothetical protein